MASIMAKRSAAPCLMAKAQSSAERPSACLTGPQSSKFRYRRSTLTKAPRKRTFVANMEKYVIQATGTSRLASAAAAPADMRAMYSCCQTDFGGNDNGNNGRFLGSKRSFGGDDSGSSNGNTSTGAILAAGLAVFIVLFPNLAAVAKTISSHESPRVTVSSSSLCLNSSVRQPSKKAAKDAIIYGEVALSAQERRMLHMGHRQLRYREAVRV